MNEPSNTWWTDKIDGENWVLFSVSFGLLHMVAPPGVGFRYAEPDEERVMWRYAVWFGDEDDPPAVCVDAPFSVSCMETREVVELLPAVHHGFVRSAMARQISRAVTFGSAEPGRCPDDDRALMAGRTLSWLADQLSAAFPSETWFKLEVGSVEIPATVDEFLRHIPTGEISLADESVTRRVSAHSVAAGRRPRQLLRGGY
jgi:hypothetical protein